MAQDVSSDGVEACVPILTYLWVCTAPLIAEGATCVSVSLGRTMGPSAGTEGQPQCTARAVATVMPAVAMMMMTAAVRLWKTWATWDLLEAPGPTHLQERRRNQFWRRGRARATRSGRYAKGPFLATELVPGYNKNT